VQANFHHELAKGPRIDMRVLVLCVVLSFAALANSQIPQPCAAPPEWTAKFFGRDRGRGFSDKGVMFYDSNRQRIAYLVEVDGSEGKDFYHEILLYKEGKMYIEDRDTRECTVSDLKDTFRPIHIPANATFEAEFFLGTSGIAGAGVLVEAWTGKTTNPNGDYYVLVTAEGCVIVNDFFFNEDTSDFIQTYFFDVVSGITDPNEFVPPSDCK
jgi:hypothetical protein